MSQDKTIALRPPGDTGSLWPLIEEDAELGSVPEEEIETYLLFNWWYITVRDLMLHGY